MFAIFAATIVNGCVRYEMPPVSYLQCITSSLESRKTFCWGVCRTRFGRGGSSSADDSGPLSVESVTRLSSYHACSSDSQNPSAMRWGIIMVGTC
jgi:hypothetical protein